MCVTNAFEHSTDFRAMAASFARRKTVFPSAESGQARGIDVQAPGIASANARFLFDRLEHTLESCGSAAESRKRRPRASRRRSSMVGRLLVRDKELARLDETQKPSAPERQVQRRATSYVATETKTAGMSEQKQKGKQKQKQMQPRERGFRRRSAGRKLLERSRDLAFLVANEAPPSLAVSTGTFSPPRLDSLSPLAFAAMAEASPSAYAVHRTAAEQARSVALLTQGLSSVKEAAEKKCAKDAAAKAVARRAAALRRSVSAKRALARETLRATVASNARRSPVRVLTRKLVDKTASYAMEHDLQNDLSPMRKFRRKIFGDRSTVVHKFDRRRVPRNYALGLIEEGLPERTTFVDVSDCPKSAFRRHRADAGIPGRSPRLKGADGERLTGAAAFRYHRNSIRMQKGELPEGLNEAMQVELALDLQ